MGWVIACRAGGGGVGWCRGGLWNTMNVLLWVLQVLAALLYVASGVMKVFMFDKVSKDVRSFEALPRKAWMACSAFSNSSAWSG